MCKVRFECRKETISGKSSMFSMNYIDRKGKKHYCQQLTFQKFLTELSTALGNETYCTFTNSIGESIVEAQYSNWTNRFNFGKKLESDDPNLINELYKRFKIIEEWKLSIKVEKFDLVFNLA